MSELYRSFFGLKREPFTADLRIDDLLETPATKDVRERFLYAVRLGAIGVVTGEVGSGKSTALRWAAHGLHPSEYKPLSVIATSGPITELYKQIVWSLDMEMSTNSRARLIRAIRSAVSDLVESRKVHPVLIIDEANHLSAEVFSELHVITQYRQDSCPMLPILLAGQTSLLDRLSIRSVAPLASRVVARAHIEAVSLTDITHYLQHHLRIAGNKLSLFSDQAVLAIHQGSGGLYRRANHLARGALIAAASEKCQVVSPEHVRIASTELI
jgi:type II secretory pathway predicted ATPase ExeA